MIDDWLVSGMKRDRVDAAVVDYTIKLTHELGLRVVAEGVEDADVYRALRARDCDAIQGNFLSAALSEEAEPFVAKEPETTRPASPQDAAGLAASRRVAKPRRTRAGRRWRCGGW